MFLSSILRIAEVNGVSYWIKEAFTNNLAYDVKFTSDDGVLIGGFDKIDKDGNEIYRTSYNASGVGFPDFIELSDGSIASTFYASTDDPCLYKNSNQGSALISLTRLAKITRTGSSAAAGYMWVSTFSNGDYLLTINKNAPAGGIIRLSSVDNTKVWSLSDLSTLYIYNAIVDLSDNVIVSAQNSTGATGGTLLKLDSSGTVLWCKNITTADSTSITASSGNEKYRNITTDNSGNIYMAIRYSTGTRVSLIKFDTNGNILWQRTVSAVNRANNTPMVKFQNGNCYLSYFDSTTPIVCCFSDSGSFLWKRSVTISNRFSLGASTYSPVIDTNSTSLLVWLRSFGANNNSYLLKLPLDGSLTGTYNNTSYNALTTSTVSATHTISDFTVTSADNLVVSTPGALSFYGTKNTLQIG